MTVDFDALYRQHRGAIYGFLRKRGCSHELAEDLVQDTFLRAIRSASRYSEQGYRLALLMTIAQNRLFDYRKSSAVRRAARFEPGEEDRLAFGDGRPDPPDVLVVDQAMRDEIEAAFDMILAGLTPQQERVLRLRYHRELSVRDVAAATGSNEGAVKAMASRACRKLARDRRVRALRAQAVAA